MSNAALLAQIQQGKRLKKVETNDRSAPAVQTKGARGPVVVGGGGGGGGGGSVGVGGGIGGAGAGPPQLGGLFAGGVPKLKPAGKPPANKPLSLGKAPAIPKRNVDTESSTDASSVRSTPSSRLPPRLPPPRVVPPPGPSAPAIPRRPPAVPTRPRSVSPPPRPSSSAPSLPARAVPPPNRPTPPVQSTTASVLGRKPPPPPPSGRPAPPPPPPRPASVLRPTTSPAESPARSAPPPPPSRRPAPQTADQPAQPPRVRALSATPAPPSRAPPVSLHAARLSESNSSTIPPRGNDPTRRAVSVTSPGSAFVNGSKPTSRIPSPPPASGTHTFLTSADFPPPRNFTSTSKQYASGNVRGCTFDISLLA